MFILCLYLSAWLDMVMSCTETDAMTETFAQMKSVDLVSLG
jgi:hypothetical protein